jgi:ribosomal protein S18 acetylase RimI-like enzyme
VPDRDVEVLIRPVRHHEIAGLADVERDGDRRYADYDGVPVGFDDTVAVSTLEVAGAEGRLWVAVSTGGGRSAGESGHGPVVGFALAEMIDGHGHLAQLSVRRAQQGRGVGRQLVETVLAWAAARGLVAVTLCTFGDVAWNRPLYEHLGFTVLPEDRWTPGVRAVFTADGELGLDLGRRVVMHRPVPGAGPVR